MYTCCRKGYSALSQTTTTLMNPKLFCNAHKYVTERLKGDPSSIFDAGQLPWMIGSKISFSLEDTLQCAISIVLRMGMPYLSDADLEGGDLGFVFEACNCLKDNNLDNAIFPYIWQEKDVDPADKTQYVISNLQCAVGYFDRLVKTLGLLEKV